MEAAQAEARKYAEARRRSASRARSASATTPSACGPRKRRRRGAQGVRGALRLGGRGRQRRLDEREKVRGALAAAKKQYAAAEAKIGELARAADAAANADLAEQRDDGDAAAARRGGGGAAHARLEE